MAEGSDDDAVGFGKPPKHSRFTVGNSGNSKGRPSKPRSVVEAVTRHLDKPVRVRMGGKVRRISQREVVVHQLFEQATKGNLSAMRLLLGYDMASRRNARDGDQAGGQILSDDTLEAMLDTYIANRRGEGEP
jgi:hypothetical protein